MPTPYTPVATDITEPEGGFAAGMAAAEIRTLKAYIQASIVPVLATYPSGNNTPQIIYQHLNFK